MTDIAPPLVIEHLSKRYVPSQPPALDDVSLRVAAGEVYGLLGANGAGKSTAIRTLLGFLRPSGGTARVCGLDITRDSVEVKRHVGYLAGDLALYPQVTARQLLRYLSRLQRQDVTARLADLVSRFEAELDKPIGQLSKGNRQKIGVIQALMHQPEVLILDEPTSGLDPLMKEVFYDAIREASRNGSAILMSSHNLDEVQHVCDRVGIIKRGVLIREQSLKNDVLLDAPLFRVVLADAAEAKKLRDSAALQVVSVQGVAMAVRPAGSIAAALKVLSGCDVKSLTTEQFNLEDEFLEYYGGNR